MSASRRRSTTEEINVEVQARATDRMDLNWPKASRAASRNQLKASADSGLPETRTHHGIAKAAPSDEKLSGVRTYHLRGYLCAVHSA
jgi:hypothetical protein